MATFIAGHWLAIAGIVSILVCFWAGYDTWHQQRGTPRELWLLVSFFVAFSALAFWGFGEEFLKLYGGFGLIAVGYYVGRAIINQAHHDLRPDDSETRRRLYVAVQITVVVSVIWVIGLLIGVDWRHFLSE
jgi:hypothetical protein